MQEGDWEQSAWWSGEVRQHCLLIPLLQAWDYGEASTAAPAAFVETEMEEARISFHKMTFDSNQENPEITTQQALK